MPKKFPILLAVLMLIHVGMAIWFALETPYRKPGIARYQGGVQVKEVGAPDERQHANYVQRLIDGRGFGVLDPKDPELEENYQNHQPPAYYVLASGFAKLAGVSDVTSDSGIRLRFLNALIGATTVAGVYFLVLWGLKREDTALCAAVMAALLPMNIALSGAISNDPLLFCLCSWTLAILAKAISDGWNWKLAVGIGLMAGLALLTKTTALALLPAIAIGYFASRGRENALCPLRATVYSLLITLLIAAPWFARNTNLYGDPLAMSAFKEAFVGTAQAKDLIGAMGSYFYWTQLVGWWTLRSLVGVFGIMDIFLPNALYVVALLALFGCWVTGLLGVSKVEPAESRKALWPCWALLIVVILLFVQFNRQYFQGQARYLLPAIGPLAALFGIGLTRSSKHAKVFVGIAAMFLLGIGVYSATQLKPEFEKRVIPPEFQEL